MFSWKYWPIGEHLSQNATYRPDVNGLCVALGIQHDLWGSVPPGSYVLRQEACVVVVRVSYPCQAKITYLYERQNGQ